MSVPAGRILYIGGMPHCGSTVVDLMLGDAPGCFSTGQLGQLHDYLDQGLCSCGEPLDRCEIWSRVTGALGTEARDRLRTLGPRITRERQFARFVASPRLCRDYAHAADAVFDELFRTTGAPLLVDSTKNLSRAVALLRSSRHDVRFLHLVRDGRGYINSFNKRRREQGSAPRYRAPLVHWLLKNSSASTVVRALAGERYLRVRFEDLLTEPAATLRAISSFSGLEVAPLLERIQQRQPFRQKHIFAGNRVSRHREVRLDTQQVTRNDLEGLDPRAYWLLGGWITRLWGYHYHP